MLLNVQMLIKRNVLYVRLDGELDQQTVVNLRLRVTELMDKYNIKYLVLNFSKLRFMDSSGVGFIIGRFHRLKQTQGKIILCSMNEHIEKLVLLSGLNKICEIKRSEDDANDYLGVA